MDGRRAGGTIAAMKKKHAASSKKLRTRLPVYPNPGIVASVNGEEVKRRREAMKLSQAEAGRQIGFTAQRWSDMENGRIPNPRLVTLVAVARVLKCGLDDLVVK